MRGMDLMGRRVLRTVARCTVSGKTAEKEEEEENFFDEREKERERYYATVDATAVTLNKLNYCSSQIVARCSSRGIIAVRRNQSDREDTEFL